MTGVAQKMTLKKTVTKIGKQIVMQYCMQPMVEIFVVKANTYF